MLPGCTSCTHNDRKPMLNNPICKINESCDRVSFIISETNHENFLNENVDTEFNAHDAFLD